MRPLFEEPAAEAASARPEDCGWTRAAIANASLQQHAAKVQRRSPIRRFSSRHHHELKIVVEIVADVA